MGCGLESELICDVFGSAAMRETFSSTGTLQGWLDAEAALAAAQAEIGLIPQESAEKICENTRAELFDISKIAEQILITKHPLVPLVRQLSEKCGDAGKYVHWGATTQDIVDTGLMLQVRSALTVLHRDLVKIISNLSQHAVQHKNTPMPGRTHFQHAAPITAGYKIAVWIDDLLSVDRNIHENSQNLYGQFSGAVGTSAAIPDGAEEIRELMCRSLNLKSPRVPWHTSRYRLRYVLNVLSDLSLAAERIGHEVVRLQATEIAEMSEPISPNHVGSSTMPQKSNPHVCEFMIAGCRCLRGATLRTIDTSVHIHERDMTSWAVEWLTVPEAFVLASGICANLGEVSGGLQISEDNMRRNLDITRGQIMAESVMMMLAEHIGHEESHSLVRAASLTSIKDGIDFSNALEAMPEVQSHVTQEQLVTAMNPETYTGDCGAIVDEVCDRADRWIRESGGL